MIVLPLLVATVMYISIAIFKKKIFDNVFMGKITYILEPKISTSVLGVAIG